MVEQKLRNLLERLSTRIEDASKDGKVKMIIEIDTDIKRSFQIENKTIVSIYTIIRRRRFEPQNIYRFLARANENFSFGNIELNDEGYLQFKTSILVPDQDEVEILVNYMIEVQNRLVDYLVPKIDDLSDSNSEEIATDFRTVEFKVGLGYLH